ncbi:hypothetical protein EON65_58090, partial [archaeon]
MSSSKEDNSSSSGLSVIPAETLRITNTYFLPGIVTHNPPPAGVKVRNGRSRQPTPHPAALQAGIDRSSLLSSLQPTPHSPVSPLPHPTPHTPSGPSPSSRTYLSMKRARGLSESSAESIPQKKVTKSVLPPSTEDCEGEEAEEEEERQEEQGLKIIYSTPFPEQLSLAAGLVASPE